MRVAIYSRVSTDRQSVEMQLNLLKEYANKRGLEIVKIYEETISGGAKKRIEYENLMRDAKKRKFDIVLVDTTTPSGKLMFSLFSAFAEFERNILRERVKSGLENARKKGKKLGRPKREVDIKKILELREKGLGYRKIAKKLNVSHSTIKRRLESVTKTPPPNR